MSRNSVDAFRRRLALVGYMRHTFGVKDPGAAESVRSFYNMLEQQPEGYNAEGRSYVANVLEGLAQGVTAERLHIYDANVRGHTEALNANRVEAITLKYFQVLAALMTEYYLDRSTHEPEALLRDINRFVTQQNNSLSGGVQLPEFTAGDLNKLAYAMATGSGKTLLMHINYYQYLHYGPDPLDNILLVTTGEGMSVQHAAEMTLSGIPCQRFSASTGDLFAASPDTVKIIEIHKLVEQKSGGGESVEVASLGGHNLIFVDEGHKGTGSEAQAWRSRREALARDGFTFEYSATFGQAVAGAGSAIENEYSRAIIFDYPYPRFYADGYGKDYRILNLESDLNPTLTERYLLANLLTFYEQVRTYQSNQETFYTGYNVAPPLLVFIGHSVIAGKTRSQLTRDDHRSLSDVQELILFLYRVLRNEGDWVSQAIDAILSGHTGVQREDGSDLFADSFRVLRGTGMHAAAIYSDLLRRVFHTETAAPLHLVDLKSAEGEIGLRAGAGDRFFGVINIGDAANFLRLMEDQTAGGGLDLMIDEERFSGSLFQAINRRGSTINLLVGSRKFIEGWDSWRVSTMGLMNIGRGEGPQIIQLFGRGVRLLGRDRTLKRSEMLNGPHPNNLPLLETLNIFGVRANYMAQFRDYLAQEGIDVEERELVAIPTQPGADFVGHGLLVIRPQSHVRFEEAVTLVLTADSDCRPAIDLSPRLQTLVSDNLIREAPVPYAGAGTQRVPAHVLPLLDWSQIYRDLWRFRTARGYHNLAIPRHSLRTILEAGCYELTYPPDMLETHSFADVKRLQQLAVMILRKYVEHFVTRAHRRWEQTQLAYQLLEADDANIIPAYEARVKRSATEFLHTLQEMCLDPGLVAAEDGLPTRVHFDRHLYLPLLVADSGEDPVVKYSPPGLNRGERDFIIELRDTITDGPGLTMLETVDCELFLLRNQTRGRGVGFLVNNEQFFPDFILWLRGADWQDIVFVDPHGLLIGSNLDVNPKVQFYDTIKRYEHTLNEQAGRDNVALHSYIVSQTSFQDLRRQTGLQAFDDFNALHVYPTDQQGYVTLILQEVLRSRLHRGPRSW